MQSVRSAKTQLGVVMVNRPLAGRAAVPQDAPALLDWNGTVRLDADRAVGSSAASWQANVRNGLFERALSIGRDHEQGPHRERPETSQRMLAHLDALGEAALTSSALTNLAEETETDRPGTLWTLALLFGTLDAPEMEDAFEAWLGALDPTTFLNFRNVVEVAEAVRTAPSPTLRGRVHSWLHGSQDVLAAIALEASPATALTSEVTNRLARWDAMLVQVAVERAIARSSIEVEWPRRPSASFYLDVPALSFEVARARMLRGELDPLLALRQEQARAFEAFGPFALDILALGAEAFDQRLALLLVAGRPTNDRLLESMGRVGLASLLPRLLADLGHDDYGDDAHEALTTTLGEVGTSLRLRDRVAAWEERIAALGPSALERRLRGGEPWSPGAVLNELKREALSAHDVRVRADEILVRVVKPFSADWSAFGAPVDPILSELVRLIP